MYWFMFLFAALGLISFFDWLDSKTRSIFFSWLSVAFVVIFVALLVSPLFYEYPDAHSVPVTWKDGRLVTHPHGCFEWPWQRTKSLLTTLESGSSKFYVSGVGGKTTRKITYSVTLRVTDPDKFLRLEERRVNSWGINWGTNKLQKPFCERLSYHLSQMDEARAKELMVLGSPDDPVQQAILSVLAHNYLDPIFATDGIQVTEVSFTESYFEK